MATIKPIRIKTISEFHKLRNLPKPEHPLISIIDYSAIRFFPEDGKEVVAIFDFYSISIKSGVTGKLKYGQQQYDFDEGLMFFLAPNQIFGVEINQEEMSNASGWIMLLHPDFLWNTPLGKNIKKYEYFNYAVNEALFLSEKERDVIDAIVQNIKNEYHSNIDKFSQDIIISQLETLLNYSERFYSRQFLTRKITSHKILDRLEIFLTDYFNSNDLIDKGLPTVQSVAQSLGVSSSYLSSLLRTLTGRNTQQHIHEKLIEKAKEKLSTTDLSVSEIAYALGFEHIQSFSKLFKSKTKETPIEFRERFN